MSIHALSEKSLASQALSDQFDILLRQNASGYVDPGLVARLEALAEVANPPSNNMGGTYPQPPLFLPQCEKQPQLVVKNKTKIDWLAFTSSFDVDALKMAVSVVWSSAIFAVNVHGMPGYPVSESITVDGVRYGLIGSGAVHGRNFVSLTGTACKTLSDELVEVLHGAMELVEASITRIDLCLDFFNGERTFDHAMNAFKNGRFRRPRASREPELRTVGTTCGGQNLGRTMYVGKRDGEVMARIYEKGLEVFANMPDEFREMSIARELVSGVKPAFADDWLRLEVEYKRKDKDRPLLLEMMLKRDQYFAGAYPYFEEAVGVADGLRPVGMRTDFEVDFIAMMASAKRSYGSLLHSMSELGFTPSDIVAALSSGRNNDRLVKSGLFGRMRQAVDEFKAANPDWDVPF